MRIIQITRKKKFASALMDYWIITSMSKEDFMKKFGLEGDMCGQTEAGFPVPRIPDVSELDAVGTRIGNGQTIELELDDSVHTLFASTFDGNLSNEINLDECVSSHLTVTTKGGFKNISYPLILQE